MTMDFVMKCAGDNLLPILASHSDANLSWILTAVAVVYLYLYLQDQVLAVAGLDVFQNTRALYCIQSGYNWILRLNWQFWCNLQSHLNGNRNQHHGRTWRPNKMLGGRLRVIRREISPIGSTPASSAARETRNNLENQLSAWQLVIWSIDKAGSSW